MADVATIGLDLPIRSGPAPRVTRTNPQAQLDQFPDSATHAETLRMIVAWPAVVHRHSLRAPEGTLGLFLDARDANGPDDAFLLGTEFAHLHPLPDGSLHMTLPPDVREMVIARGWGIPHPLAGYPTVSPATMLVYAPRDENERAVVKALVGAAERFARG